MSTWKESFRGAVYRWHCDHLGHMNVKNYVGMFDQAAMHIMAMIGVNWHDMDAKGETVVDARHTIEYRNEQRAGALIVVESALTRIGAKSFTAKHRMVNIETGDLAATTEIVSVYFSLKTRQSLPIPDDLRATMEGFLVTEAS